MENPLNVTKKNIQVAPSVWNLSFTKVKVTYLDFVLFIF